MNADRLLGAILGLVLLLQWIPGAESVALLSSSRTRTDSATGETYYVDQSHFQADDATSEAKTLLGVRFSDRFLYLPLMVKGP